jgi:hypothetical protein
MWMLVRDNAIHAEADGTRTLAACPDSDDRGEAWVWSVRRVPQPDGGWRVRVDVDPEQVQVVEDLHADGRLVELVRRPGEQIVVVAVDGTHVVADRNGPWTRRLRPGDVFVVEGEEQESLLVDPAPGPGRVSVVRLTPVGDRPLRWVP